MFLLRFPGAFIYALAMLKVPTRRLKLAIGCWWPIAHKSHSLTYLQNVCFDWLCSEALGSEHQIKTTDWELGISKRRRHRTFLHANMSSIRTR